MSGHACSFAPVPLAAGRYACACGAEAWRDLASGKLKMAKRRQRRPSPTVVHRSYWDEDAEAWNPERVGRDFFRSPDDVLRERAQKMKEGRCG